MATNSDVEAWFRKYENPMKEVVLKIREIILGADPRIEECIKWQAPTFIFEGNLASFFPKSKQHASLMFHQGAQLPDKHPRLEGSGDVGRVLKLASVAETNDARADLVAIVKAWCAWKSGAASPAKRAAPKKKTKAPVKQARAKAR